MSRPTSPFAAAAGALIGAAAAWSLRRRPSPEQAPSPIPSRDSVRAALALVLADRPHQASSTPGTPITDILHARLRPGDREAVVDQMAGSAATMHAGADEATRRRMELNHAAAFGPVEVRERTGLMPVMPPEHVHSMARDWTATGGDTFLADLVGAAFEAASCAVPANGTVLDFGCSSGRVLRVLATARPDVRCLGFDPNAEAIAWASAHVPGEYLVSPQRPPLPLAEASIDAVYAISIWSHFAEEPAVTWLDEMARITRPGGALLLTTHGWDAIAAGVRRGTVTAPTVGAAAEALMTTGHHFVDVFGPDGDWGVRDPGWGNAYLAADWLVAQAQANWSIEVFRPGAIDGAQDLFVLRRRCVGVNAVVADCRA